MLAVYTGPAMASSAKFSRLFASDNDYNENDAVLVDKSMNGWMSDGVAVSTVARLTLYSRPQQILIPSVPAECFVYKACKRGR